MTFHRIPFRNLAYAGFIATLLPTTAQAATTEEVSQRMKALFASQGVDASWSAVTGDTSAMVLKGVTITAPGAPAPFPIGDIELTDLRDDGDLIVVGEMSMASYEVTGEGLDVKVAGISANGVRLPPALTQQNLWAVGFYDSATIDSLDVSLNGKPVFSARDLESEMTPPSDTTPLEFSASADSFTADLSAIDDPMTREAITELGYGTLSGDMELTGTWNPKDGTFELDQNDFNVKDAGTIGFTFELTGYTSEFVKALLDLQTKMATAKPEEQQAHNMAALGLMQQLQLVNASLRFDDASLTQKVLGFVAKKQNAQPKDIASLAKLTLPFAMAQLNNPQLTQLVTDAVGKFLDNPKSLEISVEPEQPVPFSMVAASAMTMPQALPQQLNLKVVANED